MKRHIYAGTYTGCESKGIYRFTYEDGQLHGSELFCAVKDPKYVCPYGGGLVALADLDEGCGIVLIDSEGRIIDQKIYEKVTSCYVTVHEDRVYTANYHEGTLSMAKIEDGRFTDVKTVRIADKAGCHQVLFHEDMILVPCLFLDKLLVFDRELEVKDELVFPQGTGPRHGVFCQDDGYLYLVSELSNELFRIDMEKMKILDSASVFLDGSRSLQGTAAIRMSDDEDFLYVSTRGRNVLSLIDRKKMLALQEVSCGGDHPRDFILTDGHLLCANRFSNEVVCFKLEKYGRIGDTVSRITVPEAVSLC